MLGLQCRFSWLSALPIGVLILLIASTPAAQTYPSKPVTLVIGFGAAGENHRTAHVMSEWLSERFGQPFIIQNRVGDSTNVATEAVVRAPADGYTFIVANTANAINATLSDKLNFDFMRDIAPVAGLVRVPIAIVVLPSFPAKTVPELIAHAKAHPSQVTMAAPSVTLTLAAASFTTRAGLQMPQLPYSGDTVALKDLMAGKVQLQFAGAGAAREHIISGKLRALAVSSATGVPALADIPNISNFIPGYDVNAWLGIGAPRGIASDIVERMSKEISSGLADPSVKAQLADSAHVPMPMTPAEFGKFITYETEKFRKLIESTGVKRR